MRSWLPAVLITAFFVAIVWVITHSHRPSETKPFAIDSLIASHNQFKRDVLAQLKIVQQQRDSVLRVSDARGDSLLASRRRSKVLRDSIEALIGALPTFTLDSAKCNLALQLSLQRTQELEREADLCASDRASLRQQLVQDSTEHRHAIAHLIFRIDSLHDAVVYQDTVVRPCYMTLNLGVVKPKLKCGPTTGVVAASTFLLGFLAGN